MCFSLMFFNGYVFLLNRHELDQKKLETYLLNQVPEFKAPLIISQFKFGQSNPTYLLRDGK